jgi:surfeit locus 1 family protein
MLGLIFSRKWWWTTLIVIAGIGLTIRLGFWQVGRYNQNKSFSDHLIAMRAAPEMILRGGTVPDGLIGMEYRDAQATGIFDFTSQIAVRNQVWEQSWGSEPGFILVAPLRFPDGSAVLVDRGWIPLSYNDPNSWRQFDQPGTVTVTGIIRLPAIPEMGGVPDPPRASGENSLDFWNLVNLTRLQQQIPYPILPIYIQQGPDPSLIGLPYRAISEPGPSTADTNVGYATMWFAFTIILIVGYPLYVKKQTQDVIKVKHDKH